MNVEYLPLVILPAYLFLGILILEFGQYIKPKCKTASTALIASMLMEMGNIVGAFGVVRTVDSFFETANINHRLGEYINNIVVEDVNALQNSKLFGLQGVENGLPFDKLFKKIDVDHDNGDKDELYIISTYWADPSTRLKLLTDAISRDGLEVHFLVLDECSLLAKAHASETNDREYLMEINLFEKELSKRVTDPQFKNKISVIKYDDILRGPIIAVYKNSKPSFAYTSMFLDVGTTRNYPNFIWKDDGDKESRFLQHIDRYIKKNFQKDTNTLHSHVKQFKPYKECGKD